MYIYIYIYRHKQTLYRQLFLKINLVPPGIYTNGQLCVLWHRSFVNTPNHGLKEYCHSTCRSLPTFRRHLLLPSYDLNLKAACFYGTLKLRQNAQRHVPTDNNPYCQNCVNLKFHVIFWNFRTPGLGLSYESAQQLSSSLCEPFRGSIVKKYGTYSRHNCRLWTHAVLIQWQCRKWSLSPTCGGCR